LSAVLSTAAPIRTKAGRTVQIATRNVELLLRACCRGLQSKTRRVNVGRPDFFQPTTSSPSTAMEEKQKSDTVMHMEWRDIEKDAPKIPPRQQAASKRMAAGVLGILFGFLGIHKFVLGYRGSGLTMLLVSVLSIGFAAPLMGLIGLIEGILYLTKSDEDFVATYQTGCRAWF
jgi:TM2 domain-containing membrane protein YozV